MKVAFMTNILPPYRVPFFQELSGQPDIDLHILLLSRYEKNRNWRFSPPAGLNIKVLSQFGFDFSNKWEKLVYQVNPTIALEILKARYDIVILDGWDSFAGQFSPILCRVLGIPYIIWVESTLEQRSPLRTLARPMLHSLVKNSAALVVPGSKAADYVKSLGATGDKVFLAPNSVDNEFFRIRTEKYRKLRYELKSELEINNETIILSVAQLIKRKGIDFLIPAFSLVKQDFENTGLVIVGEGGYKKELVALCHELGIKDVYFTGAITYEQIAQYYSISDIFVLPSIEEVWGLVLNEAMACGLPVVTTRVVGAVPDLIRHGHDGFVVTEGDSYQLYQAIKNILQNKDMMRSMGQHAQKRALEQFGAQDTAGGFIQAIKYASKQ